MTVFTVTGDVDPFLHASLSLGDKIYCESDAMVMMEDTLNLKGRITGGVFRGLLRKFTNGENFFQGHIEAARGAGDCLLSPTLPGAVQVLDVGEKQYLLADGAFVAATSTVQMKVKMQSIGNALFARTGGFVVMITSGQGQVAVSGFGSMFILDVDPSKEVLIDNAHVVAWDANLKYKLALSTSSGFIDGLIGSATTGEGIVLRFSGSGKVLVCSRNRENFLEWIAGRAAKPTN
ncbi:MAG: TIGR00266 family protein [Atribacterota bacterium]|jgi:uncharacterized protein (TIGR00266 family)|nr:TIGR00266 family protein [Atribacterota bacterium]